MKKIIILYTLFFAFSINIFPQVPPHAYNYNTFESSAKRLDDDNLTKEIKLYPNPVNYDFTLEFLTLDIYHIRILDNSGQKIFEQKEAKEKIVVNCQDIQPGFFFVRVLNLQTNAYFFVRVLKR